VSKTRIYELARALGLESKVVLARVQELGIEAKTASSGLDEDEVGLVQLSYQEKSAAEATPAVEDATPAVEEATPAVEDAPAAAEEATATAAAEEPSTDTEAVPPAHGEPELLEVPYGVTVAELATLMRRPTGALVKAVMAMGEMAAAAQPVPEHILSPLTEAFGFLVTVA